MARRIAISLLAALLLAGTGVHAAGPVDLKAELGLFSKYVWRGMVLTPDPVLQPAASARVVGIGLGFWGNVDTSDANGREWEFSEIDWTISYGLGIALVNLEAGLIYYDAVPALGADTAELYIKGNVNVLLSPRLAIFQDIDAHNGTYARGGVTWGNDISRTLAWELGAELGWGSQGYVNNYFPYGNGGFPAGFTDGLVGLAMPWRPIILLTVTPQVAWAALTGDAREIGGDNDTFVAGLTVTASF